MPRISAVDPEKYPALYRATERGKELAAKSRDGWAQVAELRRTRQDAAADRLVKQLLGVKGDPMPEDVKLALRARRAAMTEEEKQAERDERRTNRVLGRLAARATGPLNGSETRTEDAMATKTVAKSVKGGKGGKAQRKAPVAKKGVRDPRLPAAGSILKKEVRGKQVEVRVGESDFEYLGEKFGSLSAVAKKVSGFASVNGFLYFGLIPKKEPKA